MKQRKYKFKIGVKGDSSFAKETYIKKYSVDDSKLRSSEHLEQLIFSAEHYLKNHSFPGVYIKVYTDLGWLSFTIRTLEDFSFSIHHHVCAYCKTPTLYFADSDHNCQEKKDYKELKENYEFYFDDPVWLI